MHVVVRIKMYQDEVSDSETSATSISDGEYEGLGCSLQIRGVV